MYLLQNVGFSGIILIFKLNRLNILLLTAIFQSHQWHWTMALDNGTGQWLDDNG